MSETPDEPLLPMQAAVMAQGGCGHMVGEDHVCVLKPGHRGGHGQALDALALAEEAALLLRNYRQNADLFVDELMAVRPERAREMLLGAIALLDAVVPT